MLTFWVPAKGSGRSFKQVVKPALNGREVHLAHYREGSTEYVPSPRGHRPVVLGFGSKVLGFMQDLGLAPKGRSLTSMRGKVIEHNGTKILLTWDTGIVFHEDPSNKRSTGYARLWEIQWDVRLAMRLADTGSLEPPKGKYREVTNFGNLIRLIEKAYAKYQKPIPCACDLETVGLDPYDPEVWIVAITFTVRPGESFVLYFHEGVKGGPGRLTVPIREQIHWLLNSDKVCTVGANFKYDMSWMAEKWGMECTNFKRDEILIGSLLNENRPNSVNVLAKVFTDQGGYDDPFNQKHDKSEMHKVPKDEVIEYAGGDSSATYKIDMALLPRLKADNRLANFYVRLVHPVARIYEKIERQGVYVDVPYYMKLAKLTDRYMQAKHRQLVKELPVKLRHKYRDDLSLTRPALLTDFLFNKRWMGLQPERFTGKTGAPSTSKEHLALFKDHPEAGPWIQGLREWKQAGKIFDNYIIGFLQHLRADNMFHPTYFLGKQEWEGEEAGTTTGRTSCKDPALQTTPKHNPTWTPRLRRAFPAPPGHQILSVDYDQGELKMTAEIANEEIMLRFYIEGGRDADLHKLTGATMNHLTMEQFAELPAKVQKVYRQNSKSFNFGLIYGMMANGFVHYAKDIFGLDFTFEEAQEAIERFFGMYPGLVEWHALQIAKAKHDGYVRNPLGRIRHLPLIRAEDFMVASKQERRAINSPVQSGLADLTQFAIVVLYERYGMVPFDNTHDNLKFYVPEDDIERDAGRVLEVMENLPTKEAFGWQPRLQFTCGAEVGPNLADLKPQKFAY